MTNVTPVFVLNNQLPAFDQKQFTTLEICSAEEKTSGFETEDGTQRIGGLWRIYLRNKEARQKVILQGFAIRGVRVEVKDRNPFLVSSPDGEEKEIPATKLTINNIALSFSDEEILKTIKNLNVSVRSKLILEMDRDSMGKLTRWKTGRRFLYIDIPAKPLPRLVEMGPFRATLYDKKQKTAQRQNEAECGKCLQKGHRTAECVNPVKCRQCFRDGHKAGDTQYDMTPVIQDERSNSRDKSLENNNNNDPVSKFKTPDHTNNRKSSNRYSSSQSPAGFSVSKSPVRNRLANQDSNDTHPVKSREGPGSRGRTLQRVRKEGKRGNKGQTMLPFQREGTRSCSTKRPHSNGRTPPQHSKGKLIRCDSDVETHSASSDNDDFRDVLPN
ncbi:hypothetical protein ACOMHN_059553 [Nucella lapillus]